MNFFKKITTLFLSLFREFFVYHHSSLEFRAKLLAAMISASKQQGECEKKVLEELAKQIYKNDENRVNVLIYTVNEYVKKVINQNELGIDELILDIDKDLKLQPRYVEKINISELKKFMQCDNTEESLLLQTRVIEFLENEIKYRKK